MAGVLGLGRERPRPVLHAVSRFEDDTDGVLNRWVREDRMLIAWGGVEGKRVVR